MRVDVEIVDTGRIEGRGAPLDAVDRVAFFQQQTCEISTVLACDPCNQSRLVRQATRLPHCHLNGVIIVYFHLVRQEVEVGLADFASIRQGALC
jgi:hypothetical protein